MWPAKPKELTTPGLKPDFSRNPNLCIHITTWNCFQVHSSYRSNLRLWIGGCLRLFCPTFWLRGRFFGLRTRPRFRRQQVEPDLRVKLLLVGLLLLLLLLLLQLLQRSKPLTSHVVSSFGITALTTKTQFGLHKWRCGLVLSLLIIVSLDLSNVARWPLIF